MTPYTVSVTRALEAYVAEAGVAVTGCAFMGLTRHIWKVPYRDVADMARQALPAPGAADAPFISCTNLPTYDVIPQLEAELRIPVISANQVTMWAALRRLGTRAVGPYQALTDPAARLGPAATGAAGPAVVGPAGPVDPAVAGPVGPAAADMPGVGDGPDTEQQQEGWT